MASQLAILCPGQGGQHSRMFDLAFSDPQARELLASWPLENVLGMTLATALADQRALFSNRLAQPLIVAAALAAWQVVRSLVPPPALVAGYSIGELSAYAVANSIAAEDAITLAARRARLMDESVSPSVKQQLMAVSGIRIARLRDMLHPDSLFISIETGEDSAIIGGAKSSAAALGEKLRDMGCRINVLPVEVASHTP